MKIEEIAINTVIPYSKNNKIHDQRQIIHVANSIKEFWFLQPIVIDKNNTIIVWHCRLEWAKLLWIKKVPCIRAENLTEEQIKKYRILDNKLNESDYDIANLKLELDSLPELNFWDLIFKTTDLFPEFDTPEFNPDEYAEDEEESDDIKEGSWFAEMDWVCVRVFVKDEATAELLRKDLKELWYTNIR